MGTVVQSNILINSMETGGVVTQMIPRQWLVGGALDQRIRRKVC